MLVLSFDTSLAACSAAIVDVGKEARVLSASYCEPGKGHAEMLLHMIDDVMSQAQVGFEDIERQIVTRGPGSFTGVRVALSAARGFRLAYNIPISCPSTMQAIATNAPNFEGANPSSPIAVIIDARRHEAYAQIFDTALNPLCAPALIATDKLKNWLKPWVHEPLTLMGTGVGLIKTDDPPLPAGWEIYNEQPFPNAACFALTLREVELDDTSPDPLYLRQPDAKPQIIGQIHV